MKCVWFFIIVKKYTVIGFVRSFVALSLQRRQPHFRLSPSTLEILNAFEIVFPCLYFLQTMCWISVSALLVSTLTRSEPRMFGSSRFQIFWRNSTNCALLRCCNLRQTNERKTWKIHAFIDILEKSMISGAFYGIVLNPFHASAHTSGDSGRSSRAENEVKVLPWHVWTSWSSTSGKSSSMSWLWPTGWL